MKKIILLVLLSFLMTGCTVEYNLNIDKNQIIEDINFTVPNIDELDENSYNQLISKKNEVYFKQDKYYDVKYTATDNLNVFYHYTHNIEDFNDAKILDWCYPDRTIIQTNNNMVIYTSGSFYCMGVENKQYITSVKVNITTDYRVVSNNADEINGNTYTWYIDNDNHIDKSIIIKIDFNDKQAILSGFQIQFAIILLVFVLLAFIIYVLIKNKNKKNNSI